MTVDERFWSKVQEQGDCWVWTGCRRAGYGGFWNGTKKVQAHRWAYQRLIGPIPEGLDLDHLCRNRPCVNPYHLDPVPNAVNVGRGEAGHHMRVKAVAITRCNRGHPYSPENTRWERTGRGSFSRKCKQCQREQKRARYWSNPAAHRARRLVRQRLDGETDG